jgi:hypothetical protein
MLSVSVPYKGQFKQAQSNCIDYIAMNQGDPAVLLYGKPSFPFRRRNVTSELVDHGRFVAPDIMASAVAQWITALEDGALR